MATLIVSDRERDNLYKRYEDVVETNHDLDRSLVSFQGNRKRSHYSWLKYKEGFAAELVEHLIDRFGYSRGTLLDPFAGIGTSLLVARDHGLNGIGIELMPVGFLAMQSRLCAERVQPESFKRKSRQVCEIDWRTLYDERYALRHIPITNGAFPAETEKQIAGYRAYCDQRIRDSNVKKLFEVAAIAVLENVSYTRKDGQYLRWDYRSKNPRVKAQFDKGQIQQFDEAVSSKIIQIQRDLLSERTPRSLFNVDETRRADRGIADIRRGSCLDLLPELRDSSIDLIFTSPPYCNRYDYTRTYALELVYLGLNEWDVKQLRQAMLSCTVENHAKTEELNKKYQSLHRTADFRQIHRVYEGQLALQEILEFLESEGRLGHLNNANIPRMVRNYFYEMCVVIFELSRVLRSGGRIIMVNDNVRYAGEEIPVDLILGDFANCFGMQVEHIWTLPRGKGNSSQQMGAHGRTELRKCVYIWRKP
jgi:DNA modification methylase